MALKLSIQIIDKYRSTTVTECMTYAKNLIIYGSLSTGKSFIGQTLVLYCISKGMNVISTSFIGVRANSLGGIHIHKLLSYLQMAIYNYHHSSLPRKH